MKNSIKLLWIISIAFTVVFHSCNKEELPVLSTTSVINISATSASAGGIITSDGGSEVTARGVCWDLNANPATSDTKTTDGTGMGQFTSNLTGLTARSAYHIRAYATNSVGTAYGADISFTTLGQVPELMTQPATNISTNSATLNCTVNANYLLTTVTFEYGTTTNFGHTIAAAQSPITGDSTTNLTAEIAGLTGGTTYYFRVTAVNSLGTTNGNNMSFITLGQAATAITKAASCISASSAKLNGTVNANYLTTTVTFEYGTTINYGQTVIAAQSPLNGNFETSISAEIAGLEKGTTYHFRIKTVNSLGTTYGEDMIFITLNIPALITTAVTEITSSSAICGGSIISDGGCNVTLRGVCWGINNNPTTTDSRTTDGIGPGNFISNITGLSNETTYNIRAYAVNSMGTAYGNQLSFTTVQEDTTLKIIDAMNLGQKLSAPTPEPGKYYNDLIHPCVRFLPDGFAGHKWWMVASPYYNGNSSVENPILYFGDSREGELPPLSWTAIAIVEDTPADGGYNSDPNIYFDGDKLWVLWRENWTADCKENEASRAVFGKSTTDGITFSEKKFFAGEISGTIDHEMCPTIIDVNGKTRMYAAHHEFTPDRIPLGLSIWDIDNNDLDNNRFTKTIDVLPIYKTGFDFWHFDIFEYGGKYYCVVSPESGTEILLGQSDNGENFVFWSTPLISKEGTGRGYFYKPSAMVHQGVFYLWNPVAEIGISPMTTRIWMSEIKIDDLIKLLNGNEIKAVTN